MQHVADFRMEETYLEREPGPVALAERGPSDRIRPWSEILRAQRLFGRSQEVYGAGQVTPYDRENLAWRLNNDNRQRKEASPGRGDAPGLGANDGQSWSGGYSSLALLDLVREPGEGDRPPLLRRRKEGGDEGEERAGPSHGAALVTSTDRHQRKCS